MRNEIEDRLERGMSGAAIARELGVAKSTVSYHRKRIGQPDKRYTRTYDWVRIEEDNLAGKSVRDLMQAYGFCSSTWTKAIERRDVTPKQRASNLANYLVKDTKKMSGGIKRRLFSEGLLPKQCSSCGLGDTWQDKPISLQVDHVNGDPTDNRKSNLRTLCPNCHSQTKTWGRKKR